MGGGVPGIGLSRGILTSASSMANLSTCVSILYYTLPGPAGRYLVNWARVAESVYPTKAPKSQS